MAEVTKKRILVVEDEKAMAGVMVRKLMSSGFEVVSVEDGEAALAAAAAQKFDLILLDLMLPKLDGFGVLEGLKQLGQSIPVVVLTNLGQEGDERKVKALGAVDYLIKVHVTPAAVVEKVNHFLSLTQ